MVGRGGGVAYGDNGGEGHYQRDHRAVGRGGGWLTVTMEGMERSRGTVLLLSCRGVSSGST